MCLAHRRRNLAAVRGYDHRSYGDSFADVYDEWYDGISDVTATVARVAELAGPAGRILELGVGTGRLAVPMAEAGLRVTGVDSSDAMLARLRERDRQSAVEVVRGDMVADLPEGPFDVALIAYNTIFNLLDEDTQRRCFVAVAARLADGGAFVVEAFVPDVATHASTPSDVSVRSLSADRVVLSVTVNAPDQQRAEGQFVEFTEAGGVRLRPWAIRWATPRQLDAMAAAAGLTLADRWADMAKEPFDDDSTHQVSVYRRGPAGAPQKEW
jgi:SAM-dependent methyltransferase